MKLPVEQLITVRPQLKFKGFQPSQLKVIPATPKDIDIQLTLTRLLRSDALDRLSVKDRELVDLIAASYDKKIAGEPPLDTDYVLSGHELCAVRP